LKIKVKNTLNINDDIELYSCGVKMDQLYKVSCRVQAIPVNWMEGRTLYATLKGVKIGQLFYECYYIDYKGGNVLGAKITLRELIRCKDILPGHILNMFPLLVNYRVEGGLNHSGLVFSTNSLSETTYISKIRISDHLKVCAFRVSYDECYLILDPTVLIFNKYNKYNNDEL
jgi:hypothetical protein